MEAERGGVFFEAFDFLLAVFFFGLGPDGGVVGFLEFEDVPENAGQLVGHGGDGLGGAQVGHSPEQSVSLGGSGRVTETGEAFGAQSVDAVDGLVEHLLVEEDGIESLVLNAGRDIPLASKVREEAFEFLAAGQIRGHLAQGIHIVAEPVRIHGFGGEAFVLTLQDLAQLLNGLVWMHMVFERAWSRGLDKYGPTR